MDYDDALRYIHQIGWRGSKPGLSRTRELLDAVGNPQERLKFIHIAGTNGKGSVSAMTESVLRDCGYVTGLYTSPFINRFNERIRVNGVDIPDEELSRLVSEIKPAAEKMEDKPTEFEIITAIAMLFFEQRGCDIVVLETGLGGELDSTNVIASPEAAVITAIGYDHTDVLGNDIRDIAKAKAGIIKENSDVVIYGGPAEADEVILKTCGDKNARLYHPDFSLIVPKSSSLKGRHFAWKDYSDISIPFAAAYQMKNAVLAISVLEVLRNKGWNIEEKNILEGLANVVWQGRFEILRENPIFILDGSHNPQGASALSETLREFFSEREIVFLTGAMADKDVPGIIRHLAPFAKEFITVTPGNLRALSAENYKLMLEEMGHSAQAAQSIEDGVRKAVLAAGKNGVVCAVGSLYMSSEVRAAVENCSVWK